MRKADIKGLKKVRLQAFLLGVWHYINVHRKDNKVGRQTYDDWCPSNGNAPRRYHGHMGDGILPDLIVYQSQVDFEEEEVVFEPDMDESFDEPETESATEVTTQIYNNPLIIQQSGDGNTVIPNYGNITINKK